MADRVGQQLGNYRLVRLLGRGGFAEVYLAENVQLGRPAAVKLLHAQLASEDIEHFRNEARTIARLVHPHIVRVFDFNVQEGVPFLVMDYAPNGTLRQRYTKGTKLPIGTIVPYVRQVADALYYAHEQRVIHRDIKPENMLLGRQQEIVLSDFGIATISQSSRYQNTQDIVGTVAYMAPEQIQGKPRPASDQYALGIAVYEWLTGDRPFHGSSTEVAIQHAVATPQPMHERVPISPAVEHVVMTALDKDPNRRFSHVRAFANALEQASTMEQSAPLFQPPMVSSTMPTYSPPTAGTPLLMLNRLCRPTRQPSFQHRRALMHHELTRHRQVQCSLSIGGTAAGCMPRHGLLITGASPLLALMVPFTPGIAPMENR